MTHHRALLKAIPALLFACSASFASAGGTQNLSVTATIAPKCYFFGAAKTIALGGAIDPSGTSDVTATAGIEYKCTNGTTPGSLAPTAGGLSRTMSAGTNTLAYTLEFPSLVAGSGFSTGKEKTITVTARMTPTQFNDAVAASYSETVELTITP